MSKKLCLCCNAGVLRFVIFVQISFNFLDLKLLKIKEWQVQKQPFRDVLRTSMPNGHLRHGRSPVHLMHIFSEYLFIRTLQESCFCRSTEFSLPISDQCTLSILQTRGFLVPEENSDLQLVNRILFWLTLKWYLTMLTWTFISSKQQNPWDLYLFR